MLNVEKYNRLVIPGVGKTVTTSILCSPENFQHHSYYSTCQKVESHSLCSSCSACNG